MTHGPQGHVNIMTIIQGVVIILGIEKYKQDIKQSSMDTVSTTVYTHTTSPSADLRNVNTDQPVGNPHHQRNNKLGGRMI